MTEPNAASSKVNKFFLEIDTAIESDSLTKALRLILSNFSKFADTAPLRERVAQALALRGRKREAVSILELVARHYANAGQPTRCLAAIKQMNALQPDTTMLLDHFSALYSIRSPYIDPSVQHPQLPSPTEALDLSANEPRVGEAELFELAVDRSMQKRGLANQPTKLPALPFLSILPTETLRRVLDFIEYEIFAQSQPVLTKEEIPGDLIWTVSGNLLVRKENTHWRIPCGALLGLNGFGNPRAPSEFNVTSTKFSEILRLSADAIAKLDEEFGDFFNRLATLRRHALGERLMAAHPLFTQLDEQHRTKLVERFVGLHIKQNERLIKQGSGSPGLFIILDGKADVQRNDGDWEITIATLEPGDIFGEIGLVSDKPTVASVVSTTPAIMLFLSRADFEQAAIEHPQLAKYATQLASARLEDVDNTLSADDLAEIE